MISIRKTTGALAVLIVSVHLGGCTTLPPPAVERIQKADRAYRDGRYSVAEQLLVPVIETHGDKPDVGEALYVRGLCRLKTKRAAEARADLEKALYLTRRNELVDRLHTQLGNLEFDRERYVPAALFYEQAYDDLPNRPPKDRVGYQYGIALQRCGRFPEAKSVLTDVTTKFPRSSFASQARRKACWPHEYFTIQCGAYRNIGGAHGQAETLQEHGLEALAVPQSAASSKLYVVRVGRYRTYAAARRALPGVQRVQPDAFIIP